MFDSMKESLMDKFLNNLLDRLTEKSTWFTLVSLVGSLIGVRLAPDQTELIVGLLLTFLSFIGFSTHEEKK